MTAWTPNAYYRLYEDRHRTKRVSETRRRAEAEAAPHAEQMWIRPIPGWSNRERRSVPCVGYEAAWLPLGTEPRVGTVNLEHARDIPDREFLQAMCRVMDRRELWNLGANRWDIATDLEAQGFFSAPIRSGQPQDTVPWKLVLAKARRLIARGLIDGCPCGCRGDFELTSAGHTLIGSDREVSHG